MTTRGFLLAVGSPIALLAVFVALQHPALFLYYIGLALLAVGIGGYAAAHVFRGERDEARDRAALLESECNEHAAENARLTEARLTDPATATTVRVPLLRVVQREDRPPVADYPFPVHTAVDDDELTAIMRATEES